MRFAVHREASIHFIIVSPPHTPILAQMLSQLISRRKGHVLFETKTQGSSVYLNNNVKALIHLMIISLD